MTKKKKTRRRQTKLKSKLNGHGRGPETAWGRKRIASLRKKLDLTQEQFARELGVTYVTVNRWENGKSVPKGLSLNALEKAAGRVDG